MTITERNQKLYELRKRRDELKARLAWVEQEIWLTNEQYDRENRPDLFTEMFSNWLMTMITSKAYMLKIMKGCEGADTLTREEKFQVFCNVCDNMLNSGRMTKATHKRFTEIWWCLLNNK